MAIEKPLTKTIYNSFDNPSFEEVGGSVQILRNLDENPSFESVEPGVEVRRNLFTNPRCVDETGIYLRPNNSSIHEVSYGAPIPPQFPNPDGIGTAAVSRLRDGQTGQSAASFYNGDGPPAGKPARMVGFWIMCTSYGYTTSSISGSPIPVIALSPNTWHWVETTAPVPAGQQLLFGVVNIYGALPDVFVYVTGVTSVQGSKPVRNFFDGITSPDPDLVPAWTGTPHASESVLRAEPVRYHPGGWASTQWSRGGVRSLRIPETVFVGNPNLLKNSDFRNGLTGWQPSSGTTLSVNTLGNLVISYNNATSLYGAAAQIPMPKVKPGPVTLTAKIRRSSDQIKTRFQVESTNNYTPTLPPPGEWGVITAHLTLPVTSQTTSAFYLFGSDLGATGTVEVEWIKAEYGTVATPWTPSIEESTFRKLEPGQMMSIYARNPGQKVFLDGVLYHTTTTPDERVWVTDSGNVGLGAGWWDDLIVTNGAYDGPYFDGDTNPFNDSDISTWWEVSPNDSMSYAVVLHPPDNQFAWTSEQWSDRHLKSLRIDDQFQAQMEPGRGRNLLRDSDIPLSNNLYPTGMYYYGDRKPQEGETVTVTFKGSLGTGKHSWALYNSGGSLNLKTLARSEGSSEGVYKATFTWRMAHPSGLPVSNTYLALYPLPPTNPDVANVEWIKLEIGDQSTPYSPAPEDRRITTLEADQKFEIAARLSNQVVFVDGVERARTTRPGQRVSVQGPGIVSLGVGWWDSAITSERTYTGPYFDGSTEPFMYEGQLVRPTWYGPTHKSQSMFEMYEVQPWNPTAQWSKPENRRFTIGADRGMLYRDGLGVAWSGLVNVSRAGNDGDVGKRYIDGTLFNVSVPSSDYSATLEAFTYPDEFDACIGNLEYENTPGVTIYGQENQPFDLSYRTLQGDGTGYGEEYTIHLVYNCMAVDSGTEHTTINDSPEIGTFSFELHGIPQPIPNAKPSAYFSINSGDVNRGLLARLEEILYGTDGSVPRIPTIEEIREFLNTE